MKGRGDIKMKVKFLGKRKKIVHVVRFVKAVSTVIAVLLMIAIAVIASLVAYFWVTGYFKTTSTKISKAMQIQNAYYTGQYLGVYVQNIGQGKATLIANQCLYVDGALRTSANVNPGKLQQISYTLQESDIALVVDAISLNLGQTIKIKIVTSEGTFVEYSFTVNTFQGQNPYSLTLIASPPAGGSVAADNNGPYHYGDVVQLTATANSGWSFTGWSGDASGSTSPTSIVINGTNTVTATFTQNEYALTLNVVGGGSVSKLPDKATYHYGDNVQLLAADASGWVFSGWSGDLTGTTNPSSVVIDETPEVTATFTQNTYTLTIGTVGQGSVSLNNTGPYYYGDVVELTANPTVGWSFSDWSQDLTGSVNPETILIDGDKAVTATFTQNTYTLTANGDPSGSGNVLLNNTGPYHYGDVVQLTAIPANSSWSFSGWSGDLGGSINPENILIDGNKNVNAAFSQLTYVIHASAGPGGSILPSGDVTVTYGGDQDFTFTPEAGYNIDDVMVDFVSQGPLNYYNFTNVVAEHWISVSFVPNAYTITASYGPGGTIDPSGLVSVFYGNDQAFVITPSLGFHIGDVLVDGGSIGVPSGYTFYNVTADHTITVLFSLDVYMLTVNVNPLGTGIVSMNYTGPYHYGDVVQLTANANPGWSFSGWSGDLGGSNNPESIFLDGDKALTATFTQNQYTLTMYTVGQGSVTPGNGTGYHYGDVVQLTAAPVAGWSFQGWSSPPGGSANPASITISGNTVVTATFTAAVLDHFTITGYPTSVTAGQSFGGVVVTAYDASNNVLTTYTGQVYFTATGGGANLPYTSSSRYAFTSGDAGTHTFLGFSFSSTGSKTITVTDGTKSATTTTIAVTAADYPYYYTDLTPTSTPVGASTSFTYTITRQSGSGHNIGWATIRVPVGFTGIGGVTVTASNGGIWLSSVNGNTITVNAQSLAAELSSGSAYITITFTATAPSSPGTFGPFVSTVYEHRNQGGSGPGTLQNSGGSDPTVIVYAPGVLDHFTISAPASATAGSSFGSVIVTAYDAGNNVMTSYTGQIYFTSSDSQAVLPYTSVSKYTFVSGDNGVHTFSGFTLKTAGSQTITVTDGSVYATDSITVNPGAASKLVYTAGTSQTLIAGQVSSVITVQRQDQYSNPTTTGSITVQLASTSSNGRFYSNSGGTTLITSVTINSPSNSADFYYRDTSAGTPTLTASRTGLTSATTQFTIVAGGTVLDHFTFSTISGTKTAGTPFSITITAKDALENTVTGYSGTNSLSDSTGTISPTSTGTFTAGVWTGSVTITKAASGVTISTTGATKFGTSNSITVNPAAASKLVYVVGAEQTLLTNQMSTVIWVQRQDQYGNPTTSGDITIQLASTSSNGRFYSSSGGGTPITTRPISGGSNSANFYYRDTSAGTPTLTASYAGLTSATTQFTIYGYQLVYTAGSGQTLQTGQVSSQITVQRRDASGNPITSGSITVNLASSSGGGAFYSDSGGTTLITFVTISSPSSSASFYYKDTAAGTPTLTASSSGYKPAQTTFTINGAIQNPGFESDTSNPWIEGGSSGGGDAHNHSTDVQGHSGGYVGEVDTIDMSSNGLQYASLTQSMNPTVAVSNIPNVAGTFTAWIYNNGPGSGGYYSVEIIVYASTGGYALHYYWHVSTLSVPSDTATDKYIDMGFLPDQLPLDQWTLFSRNLYNDWVTVKGLSSSLSIGSIQLRSNGNRISSTNEQGQEIYFDDLALQTLP